MMKKQRIKFTWGAAVLTILFLAASSQVEIRAQPPTSAPTATPDAEGVIYYVVQSGEALWSIAARAGIPLRELLEINGITENDFVLPGQRLILAIVEPEPTATTTPTVTPTMSPPTPAATETPVLTTICIVAYDDVNRDGVRDAGESLREGVAFTVFSEEEVVLNYVTDGVSEPFCLEDLTPGRYNITRSIGRDEILTTSGDWALLLTAGSVLSQDFGSYLDAAEVQLSATPRVEESIQATPPPVPTTTTEEVEPESSSQNREPVWLYGGMVAALMLLVAVIVLLVRFGRPQENKTSKVAVSDDIIAGPGDEEE